jgi:hypothetical protein
MVLLMGSVDGDLDSDGTTTDLLTIKGRDGLLLVFLRANINEAVTLALAGLAKAPADDASIDYGDASISEQVAESGIVNSKAKIGDEEHVLGRLAGRVLPCRARGARSPGLAGTRLLGRFSAFSGGGLCGDLTLSWSSSSLLLALWQGD